MALPAGFAPYVTDGQWRVTDAGWFWQSTLPWGDLAFHYGRWVSWGARWAWVADGGGGCPRRFRLGRAGICPAARLC